ncbi:MAG TPA: hypothetical protein VIF15_21345 [Polyangiaceae bacterium]|jgi:hypothetical protein
MLTLIRDGGWSMFVILLFGFVALAAAAYFAVRPDRRHEGFVKWMSRAVLWSTLVGICTDLATVFHTTAEVVDVDERARMNLQGMAESLSPGILGFAFLALVALLTAIARRRLDARQA